MSSPPVPPIDFRAPPDAVRALVEAERLEHGYLYNPTFATEISLIDPLPHQRLAVYEHMLGRSRLRFLLADDAGAGKTIMTGLYLREMLARRRLRRVLIVPPAGLVGNWQRELRRFFALDFRIVRGAEAKKRNPFVGDDSNQLIISVDTLAGDRMFARLQEADTAPYDLVIFDEAHKLSADRDEETGLRATDRYLLAEALAGAPTSARTRGQRWALDWACPHLLLLTATPHMGKDFPYYCLWRLLEPTFLPTYEAFHAQPPEWKAERFLRRTKEEMVTLDGRALYPRRACHTVAYALREGEPSEQQLYEQTTRYIERYYNLSKILNRSAVRFAMGIFQRRLASSTWALLCSFRNRLARLDGLIERVQKGELTQEELFRIAHTPDPRRPDPFEDITGDEEEPVDGLEENEDATNVALGSIFARSLAELLLEREEVTRLRDLAQAVYAARAESKFLELQKLLESPAYAREKVLIFTEHRDTADFLVERLEEIGMGGLIARIDGGMDWEEREVERDRFNRALDAGGARFLVATDAAAEGINLQEQCWVMVNYDIPWNPARLEQRMGRIHRYGQHHDPVVILNLVASDTREGRVMTRLLEKLNAIRNQLQSDKVFDVIGRVFEELSIRDLMARLLETGTEEAAVQAIEGHLTPDQVRALAERERRLYGDGGDVRRHLARLRERLDQEAMRQLMPGQVAWFVAEAARLLGMRVDGDADGVFRLLGGGAVRDGLEAAGSEYPEQRQHQYTVHRRHAAQAIFLHPGEPVFERLKAELLLRYGNDALRGAVFVDPTVTEPYLLHVALAYVQRRADPSIPELAHPEVLDCRLVAVRQEQSGPCSEASLQHLLLLRSDPSAWSRLPSSLRELPGEGFRELAATYIREEVLAAAVAHHSEQRVETVAERKAAYDRAFKQLQLDLVGRHTRLKEKVDAGNQKARGALDDARERMKALRTRQGAVNSAIDREAQLIEAGEIVFKAHAWVIPSFDPNDAQQYDAAIEEAAMRTAIAYECARGALVREVHLPELALAAGLAEWPGFDLLSTMRSREVSERRCIEVKGRARQGDVELSANEWAQAATLRSDYWLYVVFDCATPRPRLVRVQDPFGCLVGKIAKVRLADADILQAAEADD